MAGVNALSSLSPALHNPEASLLPDLADVRAVSVVVTAGVVRQAVKEGNATDEQVIKVVKNEGEQSLEDYIKVSNRFLWSPVMVVRWMILMSTESKAEEVLMDRVECGMPYTDRSSLSIKGARSEKGTKGRMEGVREVHLDSITLS